MNRMNWPYKNELGQEERLSCDVLVLGGGIAGCYAAIAAARRGKSVILIEKGATVRSGAAGSGVDHWESACTNPCSKVTAEEIANAYIHEQDGYSNGIAHYIECEEGWHRLKDMEDFGGKIRDTEGEFKGADFRDDRTGLMFAYDYENRFTIRIWGSTFKPALYRECRKLGIRILDHTEATMLLVQNISDDTGGSSDGDDAAFRKHAASGTADADNASCAFGPGKRKKRCTGACGMDVRTAKFIVVSAKTTVLAMSRPARLWLFDSDLVGLSEFRPTQSIGSGHAMGYRAGLEFTMMEKSVRAEFSAAGRSFPPYSAGNNHNTWYAATMVDARGVEIPYVDRDGNELKTVRERYYPAKGQKFFLKGGVIDNPKYEYRGPETLDFEELMKRGYKLPFYADLSRMPDPERRVIWGMMVGEEGKTKIPVLKEFTARGFDPEKHMLQSYGTGWQSASFLDQERQFFGAPGGVFHDWDLETNIEALFASGDQLYASDCCGFAAATGYYAGRKAAARSETEIIGVPQEEELEEEKQRLFAPLSVKDGISWRELNKAISKAMQNYCGGVKNEALLMQGLDLLDTYEKEYAPRLSCSNPHELMRAHEVLDILTVGKLVLNACLLRKSSSVPLCFERSDYPEKDPAENDCFITIARDGGKIRSRKVPKNYYGDVKAGYELHNRDYMDGEGKQYREDSEQTAGNGCLAADHVEKFPEDSPVRDSRPETDEPPIAGRHIETAAMSAKGGNTPPRTFVAEEVSCSARPLIFDETECIGCNACVNTCQVDLLVPNPENGKPPVVLYPGECYYCGSCVMACPKEGAIRLKHPVMNLTKFVPVIRSGAGSCREERC